MAGCVANAAAQFLRHRRQAIFGADLPYYGNPEMRDRVPNTARRLPHRRRSDDWARRGKRRGGKRGKGGVRYGCDWERVI
ncbi:hypothetical protein MRX96_011949 [Rhipicephalus microplus]